MSDSARVAVFIDGSNLYHSLEENCGRADLDFEGFIYKLVAGRTLFRTYYYNIIQDAERKPQQAQEQQKFLASLYQVPRLEVRLGTFKYRGDQMVEKGLDIMLATDLLTFAWDNLYDVGILVSGDGDFAYALKAVKNTGKHIEIAAFPANLSYELAQIADDRVFFNPEYFKDLWVGSRKQPGSAAGGGGARRRRRRGGRRGGGPYQPEGAAPAQDRETPPPPGPPPPQTYRPQGAPPPPGPGGL